MVVFLSFSNFHLWPLCKAKSTKRWFDHIFIFSDLFFSTFLILENNNTQSKVIFQRNKLNYKFDICNCASWSQHFINILICYWQTGLKCVTFLCIFYYISVIDARFTITFRVRRKKENKPAEPKKRRDDFDSKRE